MKENLTKVTTSPRLQFEAVERIETMDQFEELENSLADTECYTSLVSIFVSKYNIILEFICFK